MLAGTAVLATGAAVALAAAGGQGSAGPKDDGTAITPVGYKVTPAGQQAQLGNLPLNAVLSPDKSMLLVSNAGQGTQSLQVVDPGDSEVVQTISYKSPAAIFTGLAFSPDGKRAYVSGGGREIIHTYDVADGRLTEKGSIKLPTKNPDGQAVNMYPAGIAVTPDGKRLVVADRLADAVTVVDVGDGSMATTAVGHDPYAVVLADGGNTAYVTNQGGNTVSVVDVSGAAPVQSDSIEVGTHPNAVVADAEGDTLYVANGDSDQVSVIDAATRKVTRTIGLAPYRHAPVGSNPDALALSEDGRRLYVANSGNNDIAVVDLKEGKTDGLIPTAWYPTAVIAHDGKLYVTNAKGLGAGPNNGPGYPNPTSTAATSPDQYSGSMMKGTLSTVQLDGGNKQLKRWTRTVVANNGFEQKDSPRATGAVVPRRVGEKSPIKHVIYVVKENRTYDQEFGSLSQGNGDASLNLFGDDSAPNARALEQRFVTLDNFYADAEVSAQGWNWTVAANSNPYSEQGWPANYSGRNHSYPSENGDPAIAPNKDPEHAYIWQRLADKGVGFRNYGFYVNADAAGKAAAQDPVLNAGTDHDFGPYNLSCPDSANTFPARGTTCGSPRIEEWKKEFQGYEASGELPAFEMVRLPNDHTSGTKAGMPTPQAYVADNDWALGQLVDEVSHSRFWKSTAIFVTEDDAQNGPDHVDAHRTISQVISPYTQTGRVDSTFYSTASMVRTIELLLGLSPMTQFDAYATPMVNSFTARPRVEAYDAVKPSTDLAAVNTVNSPMAKVSAKQDLTKEDQIDERTFNEAIWKSVRGAGSVMPAPRHDLYGAVPNDQAAELDDDD
ncbi:MULTISPECIES: bifunctional YncE family protein/alkaline phosphatase family protein [unclassified Streptomyces]|uniref:bifunctional YncE family protein/alkaline phosphatase family protein n=1 Tax=unclassified Streptomyces TaxID=2593676 RepID=UPI002E824412|nr:bifunctional YncE family protein/alkaline phosphatase family protein [Streptomyces sp. NBC_00589]WTI38104.1 bifunctional YncE family protein/alkaline phosphatase family protein [Streptomyces sp. NBC_00775]WUB28217.1 bifunctional YncE family protein/alkaline phosphatase family protein [Streptomyces sp. NBC_00589]